MTVIVTDETKFLDTDKEETTFDALQVGNWVGGAAEREEGSDSITAKVVVILPEDFEPGERDGKPMGGMVTQVNNGQNEFTVINRQDESVTIQVDENTRYLSGLTELKDLEKDMLVLVLTVEQEDGTILAKAIGTRRIKEDNGLNEGAPFGLQEAPIKKNFEA